MPLGPEHNESDHAAWSTSIEHVRATPGLPRPRLAAGRGHVARGEPAPTSSATPTTTRGATGFTYTVLAPDRDDVIGCVYIYPSRDGRFDADVRSWVRADRAELDAALHAAVSRWLDEDWPFAAVDYADRG